MKELFKEILQEALEAEMDTQLGYDKYDVNEKQTSNSRNGYPKKTIKTELGSVELNIPRGRNGEYEPKIVPKYQRNVTGIEEKVIALYAAGMTTRDIIVKSWIKGHSLGTLSPNPLGLSLLFYQKRIKRIVKNHQFLYRTLTTAQVAPQHCLIPLTFYR